MATHGMDPRTRLAYYLGKRRYKERCMVDNSGNGATGNQVIPLNAKAIVVNDRISWERTKGRVEERAKPLERFAKANEKWKENVEKELKEMIATMFVTGSTFHVSNFLYDSEDLFHALKEIGEPETRSRWRKGWLPMMLAVPTLEELRDQFHQHLTVEKEQIGVEDFASVFALPRTSESEKNLRAFTQKQEHIGQKVLQDGFVSKIIEYSRQGCLSALRPKLWCAMLGYGDEARLEQMKKQIETLMAENITLTPELKVIDGLHRLDLQDLADNDQYFVFQDLLSNILPTFSRDPWITTHCKSPQRPFHGLILYAAPLTYLYQDNETIYLVFRELFARYWCKLQVIENGKDRLPNLCCLFQSLVWTLCPKVLQVCTRFQVSLLDVVIPWIHSGFVRLLQVEQVLLLWDRIIAFDSLALLPVLAVSIVKFREDALLHAKSKDEIFEILHENEKLNVIVLFNLFFA